ncbi:hypothetical protein HHK36_003931 [Tetracentron sinense]|uniref:Uncharacterized protein n=1 Tax=Tetracentron sinense TaxID=13715 RepID=A0A834ZZG1_TETSI|nr:hypothetical protein HHK36_003931 [Tetracentron sinense]
MTWNVRVLQEHKRKLQVKGKIGKSINDAELTPNQLQEVLTFFCFLLALSKTFSVKKKKGKLRKAWDGSKVIYNVASWGATAIG